MKDYIHLRDLPQDKIYIKLKKGFREKFFNNAYNKFKSWDKLAKIIGVKRGDTLIARNWRKGTCCCPLSIINEINKINKIPKNELEKNISEIKSKTKLEGRGGNGGKPLKNPKFPIKINKDLTEILGYICGDGTIVKTKKKGINLAYINSEKALINYFKKLIFKVFGKVKYKLYIREGKPHYRKPNYYLRYPTIIALLILSIFDYKTGDYMELPKLIYNSKKENKKTFLRALYDDEGYVGINKKRIGIGLKPRKPVEGIKILLEDLGIKVKKIYQRKNMNIIYLSDEQNIRMFHKKIGFKHPLKIKKLNNILKKGWKFQRYENGEVKKKIINILKKERKITTKNLSKYLNRTIPTIKKQLDDLKEEDIIYFKNIRNNKTNLFYREWYLNE